MSSSVGTYFGSQAESYGKETDLIFPLRLKFLLLEKFIKATDRCLDIGVANGLHLLPVAKRAKAVVGIDISNSMIDECDRRVREENLSNVQLLCADAQRLPFPDRDFDVTYSFSTLLFLADATQAAREISRVLKPGGIAILDVTGKYNLSKRHWQRFYRQKGLERLSAFSLTEIESALADAGFEQLERHASGLLDQWKYVPGLNRLIFLDRIFHSTSGRPDFDYKISQRLPGLANRWYFVLRKRST